MVHATLDQPHRWAYVFDKLMAAASFTYQNTSVCFFGHTHVPTAFVRDAVVRGGTYSKFKVEPGRKYFVNVSSVGQPRDGNPKCGYVIYDHSQCEKQYSFIGSGRGIGKQGVKLTYATAWESFRRFNDLDNIGLTGRHYSGFIMLGIQVFNTKK